MQRDCRTAITRFVLERLREPVVVLGPSGHLVEANRSARALGLDLEALFDPGGADHRLTEFLERLFLSREASAKLVLDDERVFELQGAEEDGFFVILFQDVTGVRMLREEVARLGSCASLGLVAASSAHDLNNILTPIAILSSRLSGELESGTPAYVMANQIHAGATIASVLTREVLELARPKRAASSERVNMNDVVGCLEPLARGLLGPQIELYLAVSDEAPVTVLDRQQLKHAILNLVANARDALPAGGRVTITTRRVDDERLALAVTDNGVGMTDEVRRRAFETFFTTKGDCGGTGLGLASVQKFVRESGGDVSIDSEPLNGTTVTLVFPAEDSG